MFLGLGVPLRKQDARGGSGTCFKRDKYFHFGFEVSQTLKQISSRPIRIILNSNPDLTEFNLNNFGNFEELIL